MKSLATLFPGQGSQHPGMLKDFFETFKIISQTFEEASDTLHLDLRKLALEGSELEQSLTEHTQPLLLCASTALHRLLVQELDYRSSWVAGHSLGEYSALVAAQALPFSTALTWVRTRGHAMQAAVPQGHGSMFAILGGSDELILQLCKEASQRSQELVSPANYNAPGQTVIAGTTYALQSALELSKTHEGFKGLKLIPLSVSAPFHCALMKPAREKMQELFEAYSQTHPIAPLQVPYYPNRTAMLSQDSSQILKLLEEQVDHPVLWKQSMTALLSERPQVVIEAGPGKVLTGLMKRITKEMKLDTELKLFNLTSLDDFRALENHFKGA